MKTYTIQQIEKYITSQDSLGDVLYNLRNIDKYIINDEVTEFEDEDEIYDYICDLELHEGEKFSYDGVTYLVTDTVEDFIREYGISDFTQIIESKNVIKNY